MADISNPLQTDPSLGPAGQFINPQYATPQQLAQLRALAGTQITQHEPAKSWAGVLGGIAQTAAGYANLNRAQNQQNATYGSLQQNLEQGLGGVNQAYGTGGQGGGPGAGLLGASPGATDTPQGLAQYYTSQGLPPAGAVGLASGLNAESKLHPGAICGWRWKGWKLLQLDMVNGMVSGGRTRQLMRARSANPQTIRKSIVISPLLNWG